MSESNLSVSAAVRLVDSLSGPWLEMFWRALWQGALITALAWMVCRMLPRLRPAARCWIWWLCCLRIAASLIPPFELHVLPAPTVPKSQDIVIRTPAPTAIAITRPIAATSDTNPDLATPAANASLSAPEPTAVTGRVLLFAAWLGGFGVVLMTMAGRWREMSSVLRSAVPAQERYSVITREIAGLMHVRRAPAVRLSDKLRSPMVVGAIRPTLLMPDFAEERLSEVELRMAIAHEIAHIRRCDLSLSILPAAVRSVFFFNPAARIAAREFSVAREEACDAEALAFTREPAGNYGRLLLKVLAPGQLDDSAVALGAATNYRHLERRLRMLRNMDSRDCRPLQLRRGFRPASVFGLAACALVAAPWRLAAQNPKPEVEIAPIAPAVQAAPAALPAPAVQAAPAAPATQPGQRGQRAKRGSDTPTPGAAPAIESKPAATSTPAILSASPTAPVVISTPVQVSGVDIGAAVLPFIQTPAGEAAPKPTAPITLPADTTSTPSLSATLTEPVKPSLNTQYTSPEPKLAPVQRLGLTAKFQDAETLSRVRSLATLADPHVARSRSLSVTQALRSAKPVSTLAQARSVLVAQAARADTSTIASTYVSGSQAIVNQLSLAPIARSNIRSSIVDVRQAGSAPAVRAQSASVQQRQRISLDLGETNVYDALRRLFTEAGVSYRIDQDVRDEAMEIHLSMAAVDAPFESVLDSVLAAARNRQNPLAVKVEKGFYVVYLQGVHTPKPLVVSITRSGQRTSKIPVLGELPLIGRLFEKTDTGSLTNTEGGSAPAKRP